MSRPEFHFIFDKRDKIYNSGDTINCKVLVTAHKTFKVRYMTLRFMGQAHVEWGSGKHKRRETQTFFKEYIFLITSDTTGPILEINPGIHEYVGVFTLPRKVPSSFYHKYGHIEYTVKAKYNVLYDFPYHATATFNVQYCLDLNAYSRYLKPISNCQDKQFSWCGIYKSHPLQLKTLLRKTMWVVGENLPITVEINNNSDITVKRIEVKLIEDLFFTTTGLFPASRSKERTIFCHKFESDVKPLQKKIFNTSFFLDERHYFKTIYECKLIKCTYIIVVDVIVRGLYKGMSNKTIIFITKVPG
uniref:CSON004658 protein n=1 Tax=Culicoides sonorensis TaxID=179676 RepID=A0A336LU39_CULSO